MGVSLPRDHAGERRAARDQAGAPVLAESCERMTLRGAAGHARDQIEVFREAGVTMLDVTPAGHVPARLISTVKNWLQGA